MLYKHAVVCHIDELLAKFTMGDRRAAYCKYYNQQYGGEIPVYRGGQHGDGLGDILRGIFRFIAPVAMRGIASFASNTLQAHERGASLADAAKGAWRPALGAMVSAAQHVSKGQMGSGPSALFQGTDGIPYTRGVAYKRRVAQKRKGKTAKRSRQAHAGYNF